LVRHHHHHRPALCGVSQLQLPALNFNLLQALRELAISQAKPFHYSFVHPLAADGCYLNAILPSFTPE
jgi:hypothetical protein